MDSALGLFPLNTVLMPGAALRLHIFEDRYKTMMAHCIGRGLPFGVLLDRGGREVGDDLDPVEVGTTATIRQVSRLGSGRLYIIAAGVSRFRVRRVIDKSPYWRGTVSYLDERCASCDNELRGEAVERFKDYLEVLLSICGSELDSIELPGDAAAASYVIADALQVDVWVKQRLLEANSAAERLSAELALLNEETARLRRVRSKGDAGEHDMQARVYRARFSAN